MYPLEQLEKNRKAQNIAKETLEELKSFLKAGMSEKDIEELVSNMMIEKGSGEFWYHGLGALVLIGDRSTISISARNYIPEENNRLKDNDILSIDCSPTYDNQWGDYARTFFIENGRVVSYEKLENTDFKKGIDAEIQLHKMLIEELTVDMTYEEAYLLLSEKIKELGYINLDFHGNLGHSIEEDEKDRICLELGNKKTFREYGKPFTLEPHIALVNSNYGYKMENIYYIDNDKFIEL